MTIAFLLASIPSAFAETRTISWDPVTTYTDNTPIEAGKTVNYTAYWTTDIGLSPASLRTIGTSLPTTSTTFDPTVQGMTRGGTVYFTAKAVLNTGEESALSPAYAWVVPSVTPPPPAVLLSVAVSGPASVNEGGTGTYTATGTWDNGTTAAIVPTWSENSTFATISAGGVLTASAVTSNQAATVTATYGGRTGTASVTIVNAAAVLTGVTVTGPSSVNEGSTGTYTATGTWDNGTTAAIVPTWSENSTFATISAGGVLTASAVTSNQAATVTANYGGRTGTASVTIVDAPTVLAPDAPKNMGITGPVSSGSGEVWRLTWDPVTTYTDAAPLPPGRAVRYAAYWTDDPALSAGSLRELSSTLADPALDFDPTRRMMTKNQKTYLTVRAILDTGEASPLSAALPWVAANEGPKAPSGGAIGKKNR